MKTRVDERLIEEISKFSLQFACPHCAYFDEAEVKCSEGYPVDEHLKSSLNTSEILFCKLFEIY